jgi:hypothetical protein
VVPKYPFLWRFIYYFPFPQFNGFGNIIIRDDVAYKMDESEIKKFEFFTCLFATTNFSMSTNQRWKPTSRLFELTQESVQAKSLGAASRQKPKC